MVPTRRALLTSGSSALLAALAGCAAGEPPPGTTPSDDSPMPTDGPTTGATDTPPDVTTPASGTCQADRPHPSTGEGLPDPQTYPTRPSSPTREAVRELLRTFEAAYVYNETLAIVASEGDCLENLGVDVAEVTVERAGTGFVARVETFGSFTGENCPGVTGTDTPTPLPHADFTETAEYYFAEWFLLRNGDVVACW